MILLGLFLVLLEPHDLNVAILPTPLLSGALRRYLW